MSGLSPGTRYTYAVGTSVGELRGDDGSLSFVTAPPPGTSRPTRLWILGDSGTASREARAVRDAYYAYAGGRPPDVWLMLGDNAYDSGTDAQYQAAVFDMYPSTLASTVLWPTRGNHDVVFDGAGNDYYDIFSLPTHAEAGGIPSGAEAYYSFDYGDIHLICLDSEGSDRRADGAMMTWLASDLAATTRTWVIAFWHHPPYSKGSHDSDDPGDSGGRMRDMREHALPILEAGGVDLVLTGHSHSYERSFLLDGHYGLSSSLINAMKVDARDGRPGGAGPYHKPEEARAAHEGAVYAVAGTSGQTSGGSLDHPIMITSLNVLGSLVLDVKGHRLDGRFLDASGAIRDSFAIVKSGKGARGAAPAVVSSIRPNPAVGSTAIGFELAQAGHVSLTIVDASGRRIRTLVRETRAAGPDEIVWDGRDGSGRRVRAGVYFASIELGGRVSSRRLIITR
ncbi:MAG: T9SS type A sorting domain-containing protein [Candidatus Eisenbacteria bacterium]|uniref:T9SS type A sorting domain-containing protein n=1 Tax=Eiseniibacteriota bacterium TaxID=2212470 RepID=A0A538TFC3_UNCEI|nr:MAG: T9SS type A sorting domain-containing protein [Candidatus Eisenbacteria bacterium]